MAGEPRNSRIQRQVVQLILDRRLTPGAPLPTETELMADLGVSRNSVREALKALQALDLVEIRHGYGTYVGQASLTPLVDGLTFRILTRRPDGPGALAEILQVRQALEEGLIGRVAAVAGTADLDRLDAVVARMEEAGVAGRPFAELDREFHEVLYAPLGNALVPQLLGAFWTVFRRVAGARARPDDPAPGVTVGRHRDIVTALRAGDAAGARQAMAVHFRGVEERTAGVRDRPFGAQEAGHSAPPAPVGRRKPAGPDAERDHRGPKSETGRRWGATGRDGRDR